MSRIARLSEKSVTESHTLELICGRGDKGKTEEKKSSEVENSSIWEPIQSLDVLIESKMFRPVAVCIMWREKAYWNEKVMGYWITLGVNKGDIIGNSTKRSDWIYVQWNGTWRIQKYMGLNIHYSAVSLIVLFQESIKKYFIKLSYLEPTKLQLRNDRIVINISNTRFNIILPIDISGFNTNRNSFFL